MPRGPSWQFPRLELEAGCEVSMVISRCSGQAADCAGLDSGLSSGSSPGNSGDADVADVKDATQYINV